MSAGLASALEISAKIIRAAQGTDMKAALSDLAHRYEVAKIAFDADNSGYTFGMCAGFAYSIQALSDLIDGTDPSLTAR